MQVIQFPPATPVLDSVWQRVRLGVASEIATLTLPGIDKVFVFNVPDETSIEVPCIQVTLEEGQEEDGETTTFLYDDVVYPVNVFLVDRASIMQHERSAEWLGWRRAVARHLRDLLTLPGVPECWDVRVKYLKALSGSLKDGAYQWQAGGLVVRAYCNEAKERHDSPAEG